MGKLTDLAGKIDALPALSSVAQELLTLDIESNLLNVEKLTAMLEREPQIAARLVALANSPVFGGYRKIVSLNDAIRLLGLKRTKMVSSQLAMSSILETGSGNLDYDAILSHSFAIAHCMSVLPKFMPQEVRPPQEEVMMAGLIHDLGIVALDYIDNEAVSDLCYAIAHSPKKNIEEIETELLGTTHAEVGAVLAKKWGLPDTLVNAIRFHHSPDYVVHDDPPINLEKLISISEKIVPNLFFNEPMSSARISDVEWLGIGVMPEDADEIIHAVKTAANQ